MIAKEKAIELVEKHKQLIPDVDSWGDSVDEDVLIKMAADHALISVELVIIEMTKIGQIFNSANSIEYWKEVEEEIKKL